ncbi:MAG: peptide chain release factor 3 [Trueperaceae bacterium]
MTSIRTPTLAEEIQRRRTFAIISHPDAGKTTLTEKLLLYSGAIREAGAVASKAGGRRATSDWMSMEQERGISISSAALQVLYRGFVLNLLDTPGHQDFSEDTYRTLTAADSAVMLLDGARGVQEQTRKLFKVSRERGIPIFTFINKLDRPALDPYALLDEVEAVLGIQPIPITWPIGDGVDFQGVYERPERKLHLFERVARNASQSPVTTVDPADATVEKLIGSAAQKKLMEDMALLDELLPPIDAGRFLEGEFTPVFFGSVLTNFGVQLFLDHFLRLAPGPEQLATNSGPVAPDSKEFTAFVFKLQANMNKQHRDRTAFVRISSGRFERGMQVIHSRSGREVKLGQAHTLFAQERETVEHAYPGDIVGLVNPGLFRIGDVLSSKAGLEIVDFPRFAPEAFALVHPALADRRKSFRKGLEQLAEEGVVQVFYPAQGARDPVLGAVGSLQFDVFKHRMLDEYNVEVRLDSLPYKLIRWLSETPNPQPRFGLLVHDRDERPVTLFKQEHEIRYFRTEHPGVELFDVPFEGEIIRL